MAEVRQNIYNRRKELQMTQAKVAELAGITRSGYTAIERGLRNPSLEIAQRICTALKMSVNDAFPLGK